MLVEIWVTLIGFLAGALGTTLAAGFLTGAGMRSTIIGRADCGSSFGFTAGLAVVFGLAWGTCLTTVVAVADRAGCTLRAEAQTVTV